jgi:hypothetical protein
MDVLFLKGTDELPSVQLDKANGIFEISGRSLPEDSIDFYRPILDWILKYRIDPNPTTEFVLKLDYMNTSSSKLVQDLLHTLEMVKDAKVVWYYQEDDEDMEEMGKEYAELTNLPFEFRTY